MLFFLFVSTIKWLVHRPFGIIEFFDGHRHVGLAA
jgi:hypothetical protein